MKFGTLASQWKEHVKKSKVHEGNVATGMANSQSTKKSEEIMHTSMTKTASDAIRKRIASAEVLARVAGYIAVEGIAVRKFYFRFSISLILRQNTHVYHSSVTAVP